MTTDALKRAEHTADRELVVSRLLEAPPALAWKAWTEPEHVGQWWGPNGFTTTTREMDVREGGVWRFVMHGPDGRDYVNKIVYREVRKPSRLAYEHTGDEGEPVRFEVTVTFEAEGPRTRVTMRMLFPTAEEFRRVAEEYGAVEGAYQTVARLEAYVKTLA